MSKKNAQEMQAMEAEFLQGALKNGHAEENAREIFGMMAKFAGYGFNRSHAYAYSALAFQMAYFKSHYTDVFLMSCSIILAVLILKMRCSLTLR